jgi:Zn-dependent metalloprotease
MNFRLLLASVLLLTTLGFSANAASPQTALRADAITRLSSVAEVEPTMNPVTGAVRLARFRPGAVVSDGKTLEEKSDLFLLRHGTAFGIDAPGIELERIRERIDDLGHTHLIYDQVHRGVPVFGGRMGLHFDDAGELVAANSSLVPVTPVGRVSPGLGVDQARERARLLVAKQQGVDALDLEVSIAELVVFHDGLIWGRDGSTHLTWRIEVTDGRGVREHLFVDAHDGRLLQQISGVEHINRFIYENTGSNLVWQEGDPVPYEGSGPFRDSEINNLIEVAEQTYNTFANVSGGSFISWTGDDGNMRSYYDRDGMDCPNAYFNGSSTSFCVGSATDDVVAHEWTHGYTQQTHGLVYAWQSGALNESYSDIFGEIVDLLYDSGTDAPSTVRAAATCSAATSIGEIEFVVEAPASIAGPIDARSASFNPAPPWNASGTVALADDGVGLGNDACDPLVDFEAGKVALITMANCSERFLTPVANAEAAGAIAAIVVNPLNDNITTMTGGGRLSIPAVFIGRSDGDAIRAAIADGVVVRMSSGGDGSLRWLVAEDSSAFGGAIRDMWNPECLGDPGSVFSNNYYCSDGDNGGVHTNSGVPNHAFAMLVDGGSANGIEVPAIGLTRAAHVYWRAMSVYQFPLSDFRDHAEVLATSCEDLLGAPLPDLFTGEVSADVLTAADCAAVDAAMLATQMREWPSQCNFKTVLDPDAPFVAGDIEVFSESFNTRPASWTLSNVGVFPEYVPRDWLWTESVPDGGDGGAFYAMDSPDLGNCQSGSNDQSGVVRLDSPSIALPLATRPVLTFDHYVATEDRVDGGNLKISVNGGAFELVSGNAFIFNSYNDELRAPQWNDNPLAGEQAFVGTNATTYRGSWGESQVDLSAYAHGGDSVVLRFDFGTDGCNGQDGWYVDNVRLVMQARERQGGTRITPAP